MNRRNQRVADLLQEQISDLLRNEAKDPRLVGLFSITQVDLSPDFRNARVYVSVLGTEAEKKELFIGLRNVAPFLHRELRSRLRLRTTPNLEFRPDDRIEQGSEVLRLLAEVAPRDRNERASPPQDA